MHSFIDRFYLNDQSRDNRFNQFGSFPAMSNTSLFNNPLNKSTITAINQATHGAFAATQPQIQAGATMNKSPFVNTGKSLFLNSTSDLINNQIPRHTKEFYKTNQEIAQEEKKNATKLQMMEEKMRGLELKSQRLEVINDFFFDMFENNLVKEELKKNQMENGNQFYGNNNPYYDANNENYDEYDDNGIQGGLVNKKGKGNSNKLKREVNQQLPLHTNESVKINQDQIGANKESKFDPRAFQQKTLKNATKVMKNLKKSVADYILEEQLKKNEEMQSITEEIFEIKSDLQNKIRRIQEKQRVQMEGLAYVLQNAGNPKIESLAQRILSSQYYNYQNDALNLSPKKERNVDDNLSVSSYRKQSSMKIGANQKYPKSPFKPSHVGMISEEAELASKRKNTNDMYPDDLKYRSESPKKSPKKGGSPKKNVSPKKNQSPKKSVNKNSPSKSKNKSSKFM